MASIGKVSVQIVPDISAFSESLTRELLTEAIAALLLQRLPRNVGVGDLRVVAAALQEKFLIAPKPTDGEALDTHAART